MSYMSWCELAQQTVVSFSEQTGDGCRRGGLGVGLVIGDRRHGRVCMGVFELSPAFIVFHLH